jgi:ArsR family transcriptional regulator
VEEYIEQFKALSDKTRLKILWLLMKAETKVCVCEIMDSLEESHCNISRHLKILKHAGLVKEKKDGRWAYFSLPEQSSPFQELIRQAILSIPEEYCFTHTQKLKLRLSLRENEKCVIGLKNEQWVQALNILTAKNKQDIKEIQDIGHR